MIAFPDTSFLCALHVRQDNSLAAARHFESLPGPLTVSSLLLYEFRQSVRFQIWLHGRDRTRGYARGVAEAALANLERNLDDGALQLLPVEWQEVHQLAEGLSKRHTVAGGHRSLDLLHVATALHLGAREFLSFDLNQRRVALLEKLKVKPAGER